MKLDKADEVIKPPNISNKEQEEINSIVNGAFEDYKQQERRQVGNDKVYEVALENKNEMLRIIKALLKIREEQRKTNTLFDGFFKKTWKLAISLFFVSLLSGYSIAVFHHNSIKPFFKDIVKEVFKSVVKVDS